MKALLWAGVAAPIVYFATQIAAIALNPSFNLVEQQPSDLGIAAMHLPIVTNVGFAVSGIAFVLGGLGLFAGLRSVGGNVIVAALAGVTLAVLGFAIAMSGFFPLPNPLHYAFGLYPVGILPPLFVALGYKKGGVARWIALAGSLLCVAIFAVASFGGMANAGNAGLFTRAISIVLFATIAYECWSLMQRLRSAG
ncbi:MAG: DUF998 domain-containing protein [Proteobacteria bacterium]|nr:DUF998 domain-containing protein [Pseudomonadota bacterium]